MTLLDLLSESTRNELARVAMLVARLGVVVLGLASFALALSSTWQIRKNLVLQRTPVSWAVALLPGPAAVEGTAEAAEATLEGPLSGQPCVYYRKLVERERTNRDGKKSWSKVDSVVRWTAMRCRDATGAALIVPDGADFRAPQVRQNRDGDLRYTEYAIRPGDALFVFGSYDGSRFSASGRVPFVVSALGEAKYRSARGIAAFVAICTAIIFATFAIYLACYGFQLHHIFTYLGLLAAIVPTWLFLQWFILTATQLKFGAGTLSEARQQIAAEPADTLRCGLLKQTYNDGVERFQSYRDSPPNRLVAWLGGIGSFDTERLTDSEAELIRPYPLPDRPQPALHAAIGGLAGLVGLGLLGGLSYRGFRKLLLKRLIENLPTSPAAGVVVGLTELAGRLRPATVARRYLDPVAVALAKLEGPPRRDGGRLRSRYSGTECVWYRYEAREKRGSGKRSKWVTVESGEVSRPFWLEDDSGRILVDPQGATVTGRLVYSEGRPGRVEVEWVLNEQDQLYVLGAAHLRHPDDRALTIAAADPAQTYMISVEPEYQVMLGHARAGFLLLNVALVGGTVAVLSLLATRGYSPFDFFLGGLFPLSYLTLLAVLFLYNDLIFLRERVRRALAMIDVALQKRAELVPNLVHVAQQYLGHERDLQKKLAAMRAGGFESIDEREAADQCQRTGAAAFLGLAEKYPDLKGNQLMLDLQRRLAEIENEIAFARAGYNDSVERHNTRIGSIPELFLARLIGMRPVAPFAAARGERAAGAVAVR